MRRFVHKKVMQNRNFGFGLGAIRLVLVFSPYDNVFGTRKV